MKQASNSNAPYNFAWNLIHFLLRDLSGYMKPTGTVLCPNLKCLSVTKPSEREQKTSMTKNEQDVHQNLELQTMQLNCECFDRHVNVRLIVKALRYKNSIVHQIVSEKLRKWKIFNKQVLQIDPITDKTQRRNALFFRLKSS